MIRITQNTLAHDVPVASQAHEYLVASEVLVFQTPVVSLSAFKKDEVNQPYSELLEPLAEFERLSQSNATLRYSGFGQFNGADRKVDYWRKANVVQIDIQGVPMCRVDLHGEHIHILNQRPFDDKLNLEVVTGPALVVLLAQKGIYCMHAGAIESVTGTIAFVAESGSGKSTLSAHVDKYWRQVSDDITPLTLNRSDRSVELLSDFPQLKLDGLTVISSSPTKSELDFLIRIDRTASAKIEFRQLGRTEAMLQIIRHTVAAKLFDKDVMRAHATFAKELSGLVPVIEVAYPRDLGLLPELREKIVEYLAQVSV